MEDFECVGRLVRVVFVWVIGVVEFELDRELQELELSSASLRISGSVSDEDARCLDALGAMLAILSQRWVP